MSKLLSLYRNELIKTFRKTSVLVISIVMVSLLIFIGLVAFAIGNASGNTVSEGTVNEIAQILIDIGNVFVLILLIIVGGSSFSQEFSTGSIKLLVISPTKRWKVVTAKLFSIVTLGFAFIIVNFLISIAIPSITFGSKGISEFAYLTASGEAKMGFFLSELLYALISFIDVIVVAIFAFMLSTVTRNTAASVATSISVYFGGNIVTAIFEFANSRNILKFIPFSNLSLFYRIFPQSDYLSVFSYGSSQGPGVLFSVIYLIVLVFCMLYTTYDSFIRRDI